MSNNICQRKTGRCHNMKLSDLVKTTEIKIPNTDIVVKVKTELSWFEQQECMKLEKEEDIGQYLITKLIIGWNLEDDDRKTLPIEMDIIRRLPVGIILPIITELMKIAGERLSKKKISPKI